MSVQESTAAFLTAALASKKQHATGSETGSSEHEIDIPSASTDNKVQSMHAEQSLNSVEADDRNSCKDASQVKFIVAWVLNFSYRI